jgi:hypothetical protein
MALYGMIRAIVFQGVPTIEGHGRDVYMIASPSKQQIPSTPLRSGLDYKLHQ